VIPAKPLLESKMVTRYGASAADERAGAAASPSPAAGVQRFGRGVHT